MSVNLKLARDFDKKKRQRVRVTHDRKKERKKEHEAVKHVLSQSDTALSPLCSGHARFGSVTIRDFRKFSSSITDSI